MDDTTRGLTDPDDLGGGRATRDAQPRATDATRRAAPTRGTSGRSATNSKSASNSDLDRDADIRTRELQAEIAETRAELSDTVQALQEKLRPSNIMSEGTEALKTAATERVSDMAETATDTAYRIVESTRQNPWPALMIGAGVTWLLIDRTRDGGRFGTERYPSRRYPTAEHEGTYAEGIRNTTKRAQTGLQRMLHENPLLVAAAAVLTGAALGGALPQTDKENELMGEARDQVIDRAQGAAREAADSVRDVAVAVQQVAREVADPSPH